MISLEYLEIFTIQNVSIKSKINGGRIVGRGGFTIQNVSIKLVEYNPTQKVFLTGWLNRVDRKEKYLKEMM